MRKEPLSEHCSIMAHPERTTLPSDCPKDAAYIKLTDEGGSSDLHPITPFPIVVEGGAGDDNVTVIGEARNPVLIDGGKGNDSVIVKGGGPATGDPAESGLVMGPSSDGHSGEGRVVQKDGALPIEMPTPAGMTLLGAMLIAFATIGALGWRAMMGKRIERFR